MTMLALKELTFREKKQSSLEVVSLEYKWLVKPVWISNRTRKEIVLPAEVGEGSKEVKTIRMDLGVVESC